MTVLTREDIDEPAGTLHCGYSCAGGLRRYHVRALRLACRPIYQLRGSAYSRRFWFWWTACGSMIRRRGITMRISLFRCRTSSGSKCCLGPGSSIYGADAFGGIVNIITRRSDRAVQASISGGQNGFVEGSFSAGLQKGKFEQSISVSANRSSGFQYDRDFRASRSSARIKFWRTHHSSCVLMRTRNSAPTVFMAPRLQRNGRIRHWSPSSIRFDGNSGPKTVFQSLLPHSWRPVSLRYRVLPAF